MGLWWNDQVYTREAGVRQLERWITTIARKFIVKLLNRWSYNLVVDIEKSC